MALHLRLMLKRLYPFILFRSLAQFAYWLALVAATAAIASQFLRGGELEACIVGGMIGSSFPWISMLPYELRVDTPDTRACLVQVVGFLVRSNFALVNGENRTQLGVGDWTANRPWWRKWKGNDVEVSVDGATVVVRGPRSMIKPLCQNFRGPWRKVHDSA